MTLFSDVFSMVRACPECQKFAGRQKLFPFPLKPIVVDAPFQQWGLDFISEIYPPSSGQHQYILTAMDFFTKWLDVIPTRRVTDKINMKFLEEYIFAWFVCTHRLLNDNTLSFNLVDMVHFDEIYNIIIKHYTPYYP